MGRNRRPRAHHARRDVHRASRTRDRTRDLDQIKFTDMVPERYAKLSSQEVDLEKPGLAQYYCVECARYFELDLALQRHKQTKVHKRRVKQLNEEVYTIEESERAAGLGRENKRATAVPQASSVDMIT